MKLIKSPLNFQDFYILESSYKFIEPEEDTIKQNEIFDQYELDFDFMFKKQNHGETFIFTKIKINEIENPLPGYIMSIEAVTIFEFKTDELTEDEKNDLMHISGLSIAINNLRNYISNITTYFPFGKFQLPAIDIKSLHLEKRKKMEEKMAKKKKK